jgi:hypothetical protein
VRYQTIDSSSSRAMIRVSGIVRNPSPIPRAPRPGSYLPLGPSITNILPNLATHLLPHDPVQFDLTTGSGMFATIIIYVNYIGTQQFETIYDSLTFTSDFLGCNKTPISSGFRFVLKRTDGWLGSRIGLYVKAIDSVGQVLV